MAAVFIALVVIALRSTFSQYHARWQTYELHVTPESIRRTMQGHPDVEIRRADIARVEDRDVGLIVHGRGREEHLIVPRGVAGFEELRSEIRPAAGVQLPDTRHIAALAIVASLAGVAAFAVGSISRHPLVVLACGLAFLAFAIWTIVIVRRNPHMDADMRRNIWMALVPAIALIGRGISLLG